MMLINALIIFVASIVFLISLKKAKNDAFYQDSWIVSLFGIYVWGDGLVLAPFWMLSGMVFFFLSMGQIIQYLLVFYALRSFYEVLYWIVHQVAKKDYQPPFFRHISWLGANEAAILYQLIHMCIVFFALIGLSYTLR